LTLSVPGNVVINSAALQWNTDNSSILNLTLQADPSQILVTALEAGSCTVSVTDGSFSGLIVIDIVGPNSGTLTVIPGIAF